MKGFFPWLREALFGTPKQQHPKCSIEYCAGYAAPHYGAGCCAQHHMYYCISTAEKVRPTGTPPLCAPTDGFAPVDLSFLTKREEKKS